MTCTCGRRASERSAEKIRTGVRRGAQSAGRRAPVGEENEVFNQGQTEQVHVRGEE
jgi:hypothetical protein